MATRTKRSKLEPGTCGVCGVTLGTPHSGNCPLGAPPAVPATNGHAAPVAADGPLFDIHDLSPTENERPAPVRINDHPYQWARFGNLGLRARNELVELSDQIQRVKSLPHREMTDEDEQAHAAAVVRVIEIVLPALTPEHLAVLDLQQREDIASAFFIELGQNARERMAAAARIMARMPTGEKSSLPSGGSTPETPGGTG